MTSKEAFELAERLFRAMRSEDFPAEQRLQGLAMELLLIDRTARFELLKQLKFHGRLDPAMPETDAEKNQ